MIINSENGRGLGVERAEQMQLGTLYSILIFDREAKQKQKSTENKPLSNEAVFELIMQSERLEKEQQQKETKIK